MTLPLPGFPPVKMEMDYEFPDLDTPGRFPHNPRFGVLLNAEVCVLFQLCRLLSMEPDLACGDLMTAKNRTTFSELYPSRPKQAISGMLSVFSILGTLGNALVLYVYVRKKNKLPSTIFIICLAATDFMTSCVIMPFTMSIESLDYFVVYDAVCKVYFFLITCNVPFAAFIMVAIAVDRYLCICRPHCHLLDSRRSQFGIIVLALVSALFGVLTSLFHGVYMVDRFTANGNKTLLLETVRSRLTKDLANITWPCAGTGSQGMCKDQQNGTADSILQAKIAECIASGEKTVIYTGQCRVNEIILSAVFRKTYQSVYASMFLICFVIVFFLYISIYRSVFLRRKRRLQARQKTTLRLFREVSLTDTHTTGADGALQNGCEMAELNDEKRRAALESDTTLREKYLLANIRTALMLFVVTLVFILAFLPSWLMAHGVVRFHAVVFYLYFAYNVCNPIIYAFMNPTFRKELQEVICCKASRQLTSFSK